MMSEERRSLAPLIFGLVLLLLGIFLLAVNVGRIDLHLLFDLAWWTFWKSVIVALILLLGLTKLYRHFFWSQERLLEKPGRAGLLSGIFWTSVGLIALLDLLNYVEGLAFFGNYWPLILVLFGVGKILDFYRLRGRLQFRFAEVIGVIFIIGVGLASAEASEIRFPPFDWDLPLILSDRDISFGDFSGPTHVWTQEERVSAEGLQALELQNFYGDINIEASLRGDVEFRLRKVVYERSEEEARGIADQIIASFEKQEGVLTLRTNREQLEGKDYSFKTHWTIQIPENLRTNIVNSYGHVRISGLKAPCSVGNSYGRISVDRISGALTITNKYESTTARNVDGNVKIENRHGRVEVENVTGNVEVATEYNSISAERIRGDVVARNRFGQVSLQQVFGACDIAGPGSSVNAIQIEKLARIQNSHKSVTARDLAAGLDLDTSYSQVRLTDVRGPVTVRASHSDISAQTLKGGANIQALGSAVSLSSIEGPLNIATSLRRVTVEGFRGPVEVQNEYGEIALRTSEILAGGIVANNRNGSIALTLPQKADFRLYAQATAGKIESDFGPPGESLKEGGQVLQASFGLGRPEVRLQTMYSEIRIRKTGE